MTTTHLWDQFAAWWLLTRGREANLGGKTGHDDMECYHQWVAFREGHSLYLQETK